MTIPEPARPSTRGWKVAAAAAIGLAIGFLDFWWLRAGLSPGVCDFGARLTEAEGAAIAAGAGVVLGATAAAVVLAVTSVRGPLVARPVGALIGLTIVAVVALVTSTSAILMGGCARPPV